MQAPGPPAGLVGHLGEMRRDVLGLLLRSAQEYGDVVRLLLGPWEFYLINDSELLELVFQDHHPRYDKNTRTGALLRELTGDSVLTLSGQPWLVRRRMLAPFLSRKAVGGYAGMIQELTEAWLDSLPAGKTVDLASEMTRLTCRVIARALFSADFSGQAARLETAMLNALDVVYERIERLVDFSLSRRGRLRASLTELDQLVYAMMARRRSSSPELDLLSRLLDAQDEETGLSLDDRAVRNEVVTLLLAGHDTTANTLSFVWHLLGQHPPVWQRLHEEVQGRTVDLASLSSLPYLTAVIQETLRLYPPIWAVERHCPQGDVLGGFTISPGATVVTCPYVTHRKPDYWSQPERFDPERFLGPHERPRYAYFPFGGGPRQCVGQNMALLEAHLIVGRVAQCRRFVPVAGHHFSLKAGISLRPQGGLPMRVHDPTDPIDVVPSPTNRRARWRGWGRDLARDLARDSQRMRTPMGPVEFVHLGQGPPVLVLHGSPGGYDQGVLGGGHLLKHGFSLLALSRPGSLRTPLQSGPTLGDQAELAAWLAQRLKLDLAGVLGIGTGGAVALELCLRHPQQRLILMQAVTGRYQLAPSNRLLKALLFNQPGAWLTSWLGPERLARQLIDAKGFLDPAEAASLLAATLQDPERLDFLMSLLESLAPVRLRRPGVENDLEQLASWAPDLSRLELPTLIQHGTHDADVPFEHAQSAATRMTRARLTSVQGGTHLLRLAPEWEQLVAEQVAFLRSNSFQSDRLD
ncbi:MAG: hypothetical protein AMXMBFR33_07810 [Candidatus Xenobia bacterium]